jgi:dihydropyrimidinase
VSEPLLIRGGTVVSDGAAGTADVLLRDGRITALGALDVLDAAGCRTLDAGGCMVLPGGVDAHTHILGRVPADGVAALCGGTTTALAFVDAEPGERPADAARRAIEEELAESPVDVGLHGVLWEPAAQRDGDVAALAQMGVTSLKLWLAYRELGIMCDDAQAFAAMREAAHEGVLVQAHCENGGVLEALAEELRERGQLGLDQLPRARPVAAESEAVHRFLAMARLSGADPYVVHVSAAASLAEVERARGDGQTVAAEVCAHHLAFGDAVYGEPDAIRYMVAPPLRPAADVEALWAALADGRLDVYASDHSHDALDPDKTRHADDVTAVALGLPGIELRLALGFTLGVGAGRLSVERLVEVACAAPARAYGLFGRKGTLRPGADADVVVWDPAPRWTVDRDTRRDGLDYSPYDGLQLHGAPRMVIAAGELVVQERCFLGRTTPGRFLPRPRTCHARRTDHRKGST